MCMSDLVEMRTFNTKPLAVSAEYNITISWCNRSKIAILCKYKLSYSDIVYLLLLIRPE